VTKDQLKEMIRGGKKNKKKVEEKEEGGGDEISNPLPSYFDHALSSHQSTPNSGWLVWLVDWLVYKCEIFMYDNRRRYIFQISCSSSYQSTLQPSHERSIKLRKLKLN